MAGSEYFGLIGGGMMGEALVKGLIAAGLYAPERIMIAEPNADRRNHLQCCHAVKVFADGEPVWSGCETVVLAVKPQTVIAVLRGAGGQITEKHLVISIAAGVPLVALEEAVAGRGCRLVRVMPNTPAIVQECAAAISPGRLVGADDLDRTARIFNAIGSSVVVDESLLDAVTGLSGSGPAYVFSFLEALIDGGVRMGLTRPVARQLVLQTVLGSVKLAMSENLHMAELRDMVTSPGGTTIAGLHCLERQGLHGLLMDAVEAATLRSRELGAVFAAKQK